MPPGEGQVDDGVGDIPMAEQELNSPQIGACLQHVGRETMPQPVRCDVLLDAGSRP